MPMPHATAVAQMPMPHATEDAQVPMPHATKDAQMPMPHMTLDVMDFLTLLPPEDELRSELRAVTTEPLRWDTTHDAAAPAVVGASTTEPLRWDTTHDAAAPAVVGDLPPPSLPVETIAEAAQGHAPSTSTSKSSTRGTSPDGSHGSQSSGSVTSGIAHETPMMTPVVAPLLLTMAIPPSAAQPDDSLPVVHAHPLAYAQVAPWPATLEIAFPQNETAPKATKRPYGRGIDATLWDGAEAAGWKRHATKRGAWVDPNGRYYESASAVWRMRLQTNEPKPMHHHGKEYVDERLWPGASAVGWKCHAKKRGAFTDPQGRYHESASAARRVATATPEEARAMAKRKAEGQAERSARLRARKRGETLAQGSETDGAATASGDHPLSGARQVAGQEVAVDLV